jgi:hypothetical protein
MNNTPEYNREYYAQNKAWLAEQRRARRLAMSTQEQEKERERQRQRSRRHAAKRKAVLEELLTLTNELLETLNHECGRKRTTVKYGL